MSQNGALDNDVYEGNGILTSQEVTAIKRSWNAMAGNPTTKKATGMEFFYLLFTMYPEARKFFKQFQNLKDEELRISSKLKGHAASVMYSLQSYMDNMNDMEVLVELVKKTAVNHLKRGVTEEYFQLLTPVMHKLLEKQIGDQCDNVVKDSWAKLLGVVVDLVKSTREEMEKEDTN